MERSPPKALFFSPSTEALRGLVDGILCKLRPCLPFEQEREGGNYTYKSWQNYEEVKKKKDKEKIKKPINSVSYFLGFREKLTPLQKTVSFRWFSYCVFWTDKTWKWPKYLVDCRLMQLRRKIRIIIRVNLVFEHKKKKPRCSDWLLKQKHWQNDSGRLGPSPFPASLLGNKCAPQIVAPCLFDNVWWWPTYVVKFWLLTCILLLDSRVPPPTLGSSRFSRYSI